MGIYSINSLAERYVEYKQDDLPRDFTHIEEKRISYNFKVTGFNVATAAAVTLLALSIISSSISLLGFFILSYGARAAFSRSIDQTVVCSLLYNNVAGGNVDRAGLQFSEIIANGVNDTMLTERGRVEMGIVDQEWEAVALQILDFRLWMNTAPTEDANLAAVDHAHEGQPLVNEG